MSNPIKVLIIDDSESDAVLILNELKDDGFNVSSVRIESPEALKDELRGKEWDIIVCDYIMPSFSAMEAINIINENKQNIPIIILTGMLTEDLAPEVIKAGASDFISKNELKKLSAAIEREIKRKVLNIEDTVHQEEERFSSADIKNKKKAIMTIQKIFAFMLAAVFAVIIIYSTVMWNIDIKSIEKTTRDKAANLSASIAISISNFYGPKSYTKDRNTKITQLLNDINTDIGYDPSFMTPDGAVIAVYGSTHAVSRGNDLNKDIKGVLNNGVTRKVDGPRWKDKPSIVLLTRVSDASGNVLGVLAIDYSKDYYGAIKTWQKRSAITVALVLFVLLIIAIMVYFVNISVIVPIRNIKMAMDRISAGDLTVSTDIKRMDEIGELAFSFDVMRSHLKETVEKLKAEINERSLAEQALELLHLKLTRWVAELDKRTHEITLINQMGKMLQSCKTVEEFHEVTLRYAEQLFPDNHGAVYLLNDSGKFMEAVCMWGKEPIEHSFAPDGCWSLRSGHLYTANGPNNPNMLCSHIRARGTVRDFTETICVPMMAQGETIGMFHIRCEARQENNSGNITAKRSFAREQLVVAVAEHIALALSNLKLQNSLRQQSIHDVLTGLFNRRYMKDSLEREFYRARRHNIPFGVIMLDIDLFKKFNDTYGHDVGDMVLERIGKLVMGVVRPEDIACRYGGEEFLIILPGASMDGTNMCASRILSEARKLNIKNKGALIEKITVSIGIASFPNNGTSIEQIVKASDNALLAAKSAGRDRIVISNEIIVETPETNM